MFLGVVKKEILVRNSGDLVDMEYREIFGVQRGFLSHSKPRWERDILFVGRKLFWGVC